MVTAEDQGTSGVTVVIFFPAEAGSKPLPWGYSPRRGRLSGEQRPTGVFVQ
jgi:hypothetical protein